MDLIHTPILGKINPLKEYIDELSTFIQKSRQIIEFENIDIDNLLSYVTLFNDYEADFQDTKLSLIHGDFWLNNITYY